MPIFWTKPTESGLGDRLSDILYVATYARILQTDIFVTWTTYRGHENRTIRQLDPSFRYIDTQLENVRKYIRFPSNTIVVPYVEIQGKFLKEWIVDPEEMKLIRATYPTFEHAVGGTTDPRAFWLKHLQDRLTFEEFQNRFDEVAKEFGFCDTINAYLSTLPEKFMTLHIRRGDKVRPEATDGTFIHSTQIEELNELTYKCMEKAVKVYDTFFICSDEDEKKAEFVDFLVKKNKNIISIPPMLPKWQQTYFDMATMSKSSLNVASNRYSSFSRFPSLIGKKNFKSVYQVEEAGL